MTNPYLQPVASVWTRVVGAALLLAAVGLTVVLGRAGVMVMVHAEVRRQLTSSSLIIALVLLALCGICWQAGYRLALNRPGPNGSLFSRGGWFAIGIGFLALAALMAYAIVSARQPNGTDVLVIVSGAAFGVWCLVLACSQSSPT